MRANAQEIAPTRDGVIDAVTARLDLPRKHASEAYGLAEQHETNPRSVWGYVQGLTRLSQHTPWQDASYIKDIYSTDAQASGLLVMASYNWGEGRVTSGCGRCR